MAIGRIPETRRIEELVGILDSEYEALMDMMKSDVVIYLIEGYKATPKDAEEAVFCFGAWD